MRCTSIVAALAALVLGGAAVQAAGQDATSAGTDLEIAQALLHGGGGSDSSGPGGGDSSGPGGGDSSGPEGGSSGPGGGDNGGPGGGSSGPGGGDNGGPEDGGGHADGDDQTEPAVTAPPPLPIPPPAPAPPVRPTPPGAGPPPVRPSPPLAAARLVGHHLLRPAAGRVLAGLRPTLRWRGGPARVRLYNVQVFTADGRKLISVFPTGRAMRTPRTLAPGQTFIWRVWPWVRGRGYTKRPLALSWFATPSPEALAPAPGTAGP